MTLTLFLNKFASIVIFHKPCRVLKPLPWSFIALAVDAKVVSMQAGCRCGNDTKKIFSRDENKNIDYCYGSGPLYLTLS